MPTPPPPEHTRWQPGQSGNPGGYSAGRRVTNALVKMIADKGADNGLAHTWLAMALGDLKALNGRKPDFRFFKELLDRIEGPVKAEPEADDTPQTIVNLTVKANTRRRTDEQPESDDP